MCCWDQSYVLLLLGFLFLIVHIVLAPYETKTLNVLDGLFIGFHALYQLTGLIAYSAEAPETWYAVATVLLLLPLFPALYLVVSGGCDVAMRKPEEPIWLDTSMQGGIGIAKASRWLPPRYRFCDRRNHCWCHLLNPRPLLVASTKPSLQIQQKEQGVLTYSPAFNPSPMAYTNNPRGVPMVSANAAL